MAISRKKPLACPIEATLAAVSARWKARIVWQLAAEPRSFNGLRDGVPGISDRMLTAQLSQLVADGVVVSGHERSGSRYRLTTLGVALLPVLDAMRRWGEQRIAQRDRADVTPATRAVVTCGAS